MKTVDIENRSIDIYILDDIVICYVSKMKRGTYRFKDYELRIGYDKVIYFMDTQDFGTSDDITLTENGLEELGRVIEHEKSLLHHKYEN